MLAYQIVPDLFEPPVFTRGLTRIAQRLDCSEVVKRRTRESSVAYNLEIHATRDKNLIRNRNSSKGLIKSFRYNRN